jgi:hypothetical protein
MNVKNGGSENSRQVIERNFRLFDVLEREALSVKILTGFSFIGILITLLFNSNGTHDEKYGTYGSASAVIWGYGTTLLSLLCILFFKLVTQNSSSNQATLNAKSLDMYNIITLIFILWVISINVTHLKKINMGKVPKKFYELSFYSSLIIFLQSIYFFATAGYSSDSGDQGTSRKIATMMYVLAALNFALISIQQILLDHFSVDVL